MKKGDSRTLDPSGLAFSSAIFGAIVLFFTTIFTMASGMDFITPLFLALYGGLGYSVSMTGALLGMFYIAVDAFVLGYLFAWVYNKLL